MIDITDMTTINVLQITSTHIMEVPYSRHVKIKENTHYLLIVMANSREIESRPASLEKIQKLRADIKYRFDALVMNRYVESTIVNSRL